MIEQHVPEQYRNVVVTSADIDAAAASWKHIIDDSALLSRFFDAFYRITAEADSDGGTGLGDVHGSGLKTRAKFVVDVFTDAFKMLRGTDAEIKRTIQANCHHYLHDMGMRATQYGVVGNVMIRALNECGNDAWHVDHLDAWTKIVMKLVQELVRGGLREEAMLSPDELAANTLRFHPPSEALTEGEGGMSTGFGGGSSSSTGRAIAEGGAGSGHGEA